jgi:hypothetical protein
MTTTYQSNVAGGDAAIAAMRGLKQDDVSFSPTAVVEAFKPLGRESIFITGSVGYNFYDKNSILNRENIDLTGGVNGQLGPCRATLTGGYSRRQNELQDITLSRVQDAYDQTSVGIEGACGRGFGLSPNFSVTQSWSNNSLSQLQSSDYRTISATAGLSYQAPTLGSLSLFGQYSSTEFFNRIVDFNQNPEHDGYDIYGGGVRYVRQLGARIQGSVSVSYTQVSPFVGASGFGGLTYGADVTFRASSRLMLHGSVIHDVQPSNLFDSEFYVETKGIVEANYSFSSRLEASLSFAQVDRTFQGPAIVSQFDLKDDSERSIYATLTYNLRRAFISLNLRNDDRTANLQGLSYTDNRVGLTVGTRF